MASCSALPNAKRLDGSFYVRHHVAIDKGLLLQAGTLAETRALHFQRAHGYNFKSYGTAVIAVKALHKRSALEELERLYEGRVRQGLIDDPTPVSKQHRFAVEQSLE